MTRAVFACLTFAAVAALGQDTVPRLAFEVASINPATPVPTPLSNGTTTLSIRMSTQINGSRVRLEGYSLRDLILQAFRVKDQQLSGPVWMTDQRYLIEARMPVGATIDQEPEMLQSLLEERFGLKLRRESKEMSIYALVTAKGGPKFTPAAGNGGSTPGPAAGGPMGITMARSAGGGPMRIAMPAADMKGLADYLARLTDRPVIDMTGLNGKYAIELSFASEDAISAGDAADLAPSLLTALQEQLGLKLDARKAAVEILIIDRLEKTPTAN
jgi:uncharacterized protein (TIGR03435 family)